MVRSWSLVSGHLPTATIGFEEVVADVVRVTVVAGPDAGLVRAFDRPTIVVGTGDAATLRVSDRAVSRLHCELTVEPGRVRLRDLGSKNGTWVGAARVVEAELGPGAQVRVGTTTLEIGTAREPERRLRWTGGDRFGELLGASAPMQRLFAVLARVATSDAAVLVRGESGTGKELVARAIHDASPRRDAPFVVVDGAALVRTLAEAELFGHAKGAFTGADVARAGAFERAHGGTLFIDEVGEIPADVQPRLLRFLEDGTVQRLGEADRRRVDVRVVAATHRPLERMVNDGAFREDLYHRLCVVEVRLPPLRDRPEDVAVIARAMLDRLAPGDATAGAAVGRALADRAGYRWPGNVRELGNLVRRVVALGDVAGPAAAEPDDGEPRVRVDLPMLEAKRHWVEAFERRYLGRLLAETGGNVSEAARRADVDRGHLGKLVARHGIRK